MRLPRPRNFLFACVALAVVVLAVFLVGTVAAARHYTRHTILPDTRQTQYPLQLTALSPRQLEILLKVEDPRFFVHGGVDFSTPGAGITTITQALVKQLYFQKFRPGIAKLKQTVIAALVLDPLMSKEEQLRLFINTTYLGKDVRGFAQAAQTIFDKPFQELSEDEYIALVAMLIAPETFDLRRFPERNRERVRRIKLLLSGDYVPHGLCDLFYGPLDQETQKTLPPLSYFSSYYR